MSVPLLLRISAIFEGLTAAALLLAPNLVLKALLGIPPSTEAELVLERFVGVTLLSLGLGCWVARDADLAGRSASLKMMLLYNVAVAVLLAYVGLGPALAGIALWPAVVIHLLLSMWCIAGLRSK